LVEAAEASPDGRRLIESGGAKRLFPRRHVGLPVQVDRQKVTAAERFA
jgi:hypothetical protein